MENKRLLVVAFVFIVISFLFFCIISYVGVYYHENAHEQIALGHGCMNGTMNIHLFGGDFTCTEWRKEWMNGEPVSEQWVLQERYLQGQTEMLGYHLEYLVYAIFMCTMLICMMIFMVSKKDNI